MNHDFSEEAVAALNLTPLARIVGYGVAGCEPTIMGIGPVPAIGKFFLSQKCFLTYEPLDSLKKSPSKMPLLL